MDGDAAADHEMRMIEKAAAFGAAEEIQGEGRREKLRRMRARKEAEQQSRPKFKLNLSLFDNACGPSCDEADAWRQARLDAARAEQQKKERKELEARAKSGELNREVGSRSTRSSAPLGSGGGPKSPKRLHREQQERRALAAAAKLTRQEHFRDFGLLLASIESGAIAPLRGSYLVALSESGAKLRRRQELPPEAFFPAAELHELLATLPAEARGLLFVAISYRWLTPSEVRARDATSPSGDTLEMRPVSASDQHYTCKPPPPLPPPPPPPPPPIALSYVCPAVTTRSDSPPPRVSCRDPSPPSPFLPSSLPPFPSLPSLRSPLSAIPRHSPIRPASTSTSSPM